MSKIVRLGIIGLSPGNGHPYSWSALCNGYNIQSMENCGFSVIPRYLEEHSFPEDFIGNAVVTHVWTQDEELSRHIAQASNIEHVVSNFLDMIGDVDGILLARDDAETHLYYSRPFLEAGIPIYVDKPLALTVKEAMRMLELQVYPGQLFSCSALRYARELIPSAAQLASLGRVKYILGSTPKDWDKYAPHVIEPMLQLFPFLSRDTLRTSRWISQDRVVLHGECSSGLEFEVSAMGECSLPISLKIVGEDACIDFIFKDSFSAFKIALETFINSILLQDECLSSEQMLSSVFLLEAGRLSCAPS